MKPLLFIGSSLDDLRSFPEEARRRIGFELNGIQRGFEPTDWKPMNSIGQGVCELRIHLAGEWRVIYVARFTEVIYLCSTCLQKENLQDSRERYSVGQESITFYRWCIMKHKVTHSSGNVFTDLGFDPAEAAILQMRSMLMNDLRDFIESSQITQAEAAKLLGVTQTRVSDLVRGKWEKFSLEMLIALETRAGRKVRLELVA